MTDLPENDRSDWQEPGPTPSNWPRWFIGTLVALGLYVLSIGPAIRLESHGRVSPSTLEIIYAPLAFVTRSSSTAGKAVEWYVDLWLK